jgi:sugar phosphate isomerase/epimerase
MDSRRLALNAMTTRHQGFREDVAAARRWGLGGLGLWRYKLVDQPPEAVRDAVTRAGLAVTSLSYAGGFLDHPAEAISDGEVALALAEAVGARCLLTISGPTPGGSLAGHYETLVSALAALSHTAAAYGVPLALEAIHPMDLSHWTIVPTLDFALDLVERVGSEWLGVMLDLYNVWWDPRLPDAIRRAGGRLLGVQVADWRRPTRSPTDRTLPGRGVAPLAEYIGLIEAAGYRGSYELEIFSDELWQMPVDDLLSETVAWFARLEG